MVTPYAMSLAGGPGFNFFGAVERFLEFLQIPSEIESDLESMLYQRNALCKGNA